MADTHIPRTVPAELSSPTTASAPSALGRRRFLQQSAMTVGALAGVGALLDACSASSTSTGAVTLNVVYNDGGLVPKYITAFQAANPNIKIKFSKYDPIKLAATLSSNDPPDFAFGYGVYNTPNLAARGLMADLSGYFKSSSVLKETDLDPINDTWRFDRSTLKQGVGPRYGIASDFSYDYQFWYDKRAFDQAHIPYPSATEAATYAQFIEWGKALTVRQGDKIQRYGMSWGLSLYQVIQMVAQQGGSLFSSDLRKVDFTTPQAKAAMQVFLDWGQAHISPSPLDPADTWEWPLMQTQRIGIVQYGFWFGGEIVTDTNGLQDHVGFAPAPVMTGGQRVSLCSAAAGSWIPAASKHKDEAWKLMEYYHGNTNDPTTPAHVRAKSGFGIPALTSLYSEIPQGLAYQQQAFQSIKSEQAHSKVISATPYASEVAMESALASGFAPALQGQASLDSALKTITDTINLLLQQGVDQIG